MKSRLGGPVFPSIVRRSTLTQLAALEQSLETDGVLCQAQLHRHFAGLSFARLCKPFVRFSLTVRPVRNGISSETALSFVALTPLYQRHSAERIAHLAGTAEIRFKLNAPCERWTRLSSGSKRAAGCPDALFETDEGPIAVEYDSGSYSSARVLHKLSQYAALGSVVWGTSGRVRALHLRALHGSAATFFHLPWWSSEYAS